MSIVGTAGPRARGVPCGGTWRPGRNLTNSAGGLMSEQGILLPFYLVVDVSYSMLGPKLDAANRVVPEVADALAKNPILEDKIRFGLIDFSDDARVVLPLC